MFHPGVQKLTSYGVRLDFRQELEGRAVFITEQVRLFERIFNWLRHAFDQNVTA